MKPIMDIAQNLGIDPDDVELYGKYKAKLSEQLYTKLADKKDGKLILVTAINLLRQEKVKQPSALVWHRQ